IDECFCKMAQFLLLADVKKIVLKMYAAANSASATPLSVEEIHPFHVFHSLHSNKEWPFYSVCCPHKTVPTLGSKSWTSLLSGLSYNMFPPIHNHHHKRGDSLWQGSHPLWIVSQVRRHSGALCSYCRRSYQAIAYRVLRVPNGCQCDLDQVRQPSKKQLSRLQSFRELSVYSLQAPSSPSHHHICNGN